MARLPFYKDKKFYLHLLIIILTGVLLFFASFWLLKLYTRHNKEFDMPNFVGQDFQQVQKENLRDFNFILTDSVYLKGLQPGSVYQQDPVPGAKVKRGRNVYTIIVAKTPEMTTMPSDVIGSSLRHAIGLLESSGLEVDHLEFVTYYPYTKNVADHYYQGKHIEVGTELAKGSKIVLMVGFNTDEKNKTYIKVPNLIGKPATEVKSILNSAGFNLGNEVFEDNDSIQYQCVTRMSPGPSSGTIKLGTYVDVWYHSNRTMDFKKEMSELMRKESETNKPQPVVVDTVAKPEPEPEAKPETKPEAEPIELEEAESTDNETNDYEDDF